MSRSHRQKHLPEAISTIRVLSLLLILQVGVLLFVMLRLGWVVDWRRLAAQPRFDARTIDLSIALLWMLISAALTVVAAAALYVLRQTGWLLAMFIQAFILANLLSYYFFIETSILHRSNFAFALMGYSVFMVLYLNASDVRLIFSSQDDVDDEHSQGSMHEV